MVCTSFFWEGGVAVRTSRSLPPLTWFHRSVSPLRMIIVLGLWRTVHFTCFWSPLFYFSLVSHGCFLFTLKRLFRQVVATGAFYARRLEFPLLIGLLPSFVGSRSCVFSDGKKKKKKNAIVCCFHGDSKTRTSANKVDGPAAVYYHLLIPGLVNNSSIAGEHIGSSQNQTWCVVTIWPPVIVQPCQHANIQT